MRPHDLAVLEVAGALHVPHAPLQFLDVPTQSGEGLDLTHVLPLSEEVQVEDVQVNQDAFNIGCSLVLFPHQIRSRPQPIWIGGEIDVLIGVVPGIPQLAPPQPLPSGIPKSLPESLAGVETERLILSRQGLPEPSDMRLGNPLDLHVQSESVQEAPALAVIASVSLGLRDAQSSREPGVGIDIADGLKADLAVITQVVAGHSPQLFVAQVAAGPQILSCDPVAIGPTPPTPVWRRLAE